MLKKLRIKFVCLNMTIVTVILVTILCTVVGVTRQNLEKTSLEMMRDLADHPQNDTHPGRKTNVHAPYLVIRLDKAGHLPDDFSSHIVDITTFHFPLSEPSELSALAECALRSEKNTGTIPAHRLRFLRMTTPVGPCLVFLDISDEQHILSVLTRNCLLLGTAGFFVFLLVSILFARRAVKPVETAWNDQKQFVADASHELKTPLTVILTNAELLCAPDYSAADRQRFSGNILTMATQMRGLVEGLLDLSRADSGSMQPVMEPVDFGALAERALCMFEPLYFEHALTLRTELAGDVWVNGSPAHLKQVADILLDNALKYADSGSEILVRLQKQRHHCLFSVTTDGEPIPAADLKRVFRRFYRVDKSRTDSGSYGLGLSIAESIVQKHHGKIWAESGPHSNTFFVRLFMLPSGGSAHSLSCSR